MRLSVERIRWGLLLGALLLIAVLAALLSYGRYRAVKQWKQILARSGATITHETDGVTYSQAVGGKTIFTLHAQHAVPHGDGKYTLENGILLLYGANGQPADRISGAQFDYDEKEGVAHAAGEVDIEVSPPAGLAAKRANSQGSRDNSTGKADANAQPIHVRTSGLTYVKKLGVAATDQEVEIEYAGMHGWARGAEFDSGESVVHLLADVRAEGALRGTPATLTATKADLNRDANLIVLTAPEVRSGGRTVRAAGAVLHIRKDGSLETLEASGGVALKEATRTITAAALNAVMNDQSQMQHAALSGGVRMEDTSAERPMHGSAKSATVVCDSAGQPTSAVMDGGVSLVVEDRKTPGSSLTRQVGAERVTLGLLHSRQGTKVSGVHAEGAAWAKGDALVYASSSNQIGGIKTTSVAGDDLRLTLTPDAAGKEQPVRMTGTGHTRIEQRMLDGALQTSTGDTLDARFGEAAGRGLEIASAVQSGHVAMRSVPLKPDEQPSEAVAERAQFDGASDVLTLTTPQRASSSGSRVGRARLTRGDTTVEAETVRMMQQTGDALATGDVAGSFVSANAKPGTEVTHALAADAVLHRAAQTIELHGTDAAPARMWQGASQVEAANLLLDRAHDSMEAWPAGPQGKVLAVFANEKQTGTNGSGTGGPARGKSGLSNGATAERAVRVTSARMDYSGISHEAVFTGGVLAQGEEGTVQAQRGIAFLVPKRAAGTSGGQGASRQHGSAGQPDPVAASLDKIVMAGSVKLEQPGRTATGEQLLYTAATGEFVLTGTPGHPPHVTDAQQGSITGATLLFRSPDSTIVVAGATAGEPGTHRVHTETTVKK